MRESRSSAACRWELIQSVCFNDDIFICILRNCGEKYFSFVSENSQIKKVREFKELIDAQEHFSGLFNELSKDKGIAAVKFSPI